MKWITSVTLLQCNVLLGNVWVLEFIWMPLSAQILLQTKSLMATALPDARPQVGKCTLPHHKNCPGMTQGMWKKPRALIQSPKPPEPNVTEYLWVGRNTSDPWRPHPPVYRPKRSTVNISKPDITGHPQKSCVSVSLWHTGSLLNIKECAFNVVAEVNVGKSLPPCMSYRLFITLVNKTVCVPSSEI